MKVTVIDSSTRDAMCTADIHPDHFVTLATRLKIDRIPVLDSDGKVIGSQSIITHLAFIEYLKEAAL